MSVPIRIPDSPIRDSKYTRPFVAHPNSDAQEVETIDLLPEKSITQDWVTIGTFFTIAVAFGAIHVALWNFPIFAKSIERTIWRATSLAMMLIPIFEAMIIGMFAVAEKRPSQPLYSTYQPTTIPSWQTRLHGLLSSTKAFVGFVAEIGLPLLFMIVRICIIGQMFYGLHSVPEKVYTRAKWGRYIPHLSLI